MNIKTLITLTITLFFFTSTKAQNLEIDFASSAQLTKIGFHFGALVDTDSDEKYNNSGQSYSIGLTNNLHKNWRLRTELGYSINNTFISAIYSYDEGFGLRSKALVTHYTNEKVHLGIFPEYRITNDQVTFFVHGGLFITKGVGNYMSTLDRVLQADPLVPAFKLNGGLIAGSKKIKFKLFAGHTWIGKSPIFNRYQPKVSYKSISLGIGVVYKM